MSSNQLTPEGLADAIQREFPNAWQEIKGAPPPPMTQQSKNDQLVLYRAIARGLLSYLADPNNLVINSIQLSVAGSEYPFTVTGVTINASNPL